MKRKIIVAVTLILAAFFCMASIGNAVIYHYCVNNPSWVYGESSWGKIIANAWGSYSWKTGSAYVSSSWAYTNVGIFGSGANTWYGEGHTYWEPAVTK